MGTLCGSIIIPMIIRLFTKNGWNLAPKVKPPIGEEVLACSIQNGKVEYTALTYHGPAVDGNIPEDAKIYWRKWPQAPF